MARYSSDPEADRLIDDHRNIFTELLGAGSVCLNAYLRGWIGEALGRIQAAEDVNCRSKERRELEEEILQDQLADLPFEAMTGTGA